MVALGILRAHRSGKTKRSTRRQRIRLVSMKKRNQKRKRGEKTVDETHRGAEEWMKGEGGKFRAGAQTHVIICSKLLDSVMEYLRSN